MRCRKIFSCMAAFLYSGARRKGFLGKKMGGDAPQWIFVDFPPILPRLGPKMARRRSRLVDGQAGGEVGNEHRRQGAGVGS